MDDSLPDLVRDWELETRFASDKQTIHTIYVSDPARGRWRKANEEVWDQTTRLGKGAFGVVYLQKCVSGPSSGNLRAVKEIQVTLNESSDKFLSREISAIVKFSHKRFRECFVPSFGWYRNTDSIFITMEYLPLGDLESFLGKPLPDSEAKTITEQVLQGIDFMHQSKFAHRDLKPKNILVQNKGPNWWVKISDFGCSKQSESTFLHSIMVGTEPYLAPELQDIFVPSDQYDTDDEEDLNSFETPVYTHAVDIWALGAITFRIATGQLPFPYPPRKRLSRYVAQGKPFPSNELLSTECHDFVVSVMSRSPRDRPAAATALKHAWIASRHGTEDTGLVSDPGITFNAHIDLETRPNSPQNTSDEASGSWTTIRQSLTIRQKPSPGVLEPKERSSTEFSDASGSWSTVQRDPIEGSPTVSTTIKRTKSQDTLVPQLLPLKLTDPWNTEKDAVPTACAFSVDSQWLFSTSYATFRLWKQTDQGGFREIIKDNVNWHSIQGVAVSSNAKRLISHHGYKDDGSYLRSWRVTYVNGLFKCLSKSRWGVDRGTYPYRRISADACRVLEVKHTMNGSHGSSKIAILEVDPEDNFKLLRSQRFNFIAKAFFLSADGEHYIVFHDEKCTFFCCKHANGSEFQLWSAKKRVEYGWVNARKTARFSPDGRWCIVWYNQVFRVFRRVGEKWEAGLQVGFDTEAAAFSADSKRFAIGSPGGAISIWRIDSEHSFTLDKRMQLQTQGEVRYVTFSPDSQFLATEAMGKFQVWKIF